MNISEEQYKDLIQIIPDIIYEIDIDGRFAFVNDAIKQLGYNPEELIGKHFSEIIHPDDFESVSRAIVLPKYEGKITGDINSPKLFDERRTDGRVTKNLEVRLVLRNKEETKIDYSYGELHSSGKWDRPVTDKDKRLLGSIGVIRDISKRKEIEGYYRKAQENFRGIFESSKDSIAYFDLDGVLLEVNDSFLNLTGYSREELVANRKYQDITPKEYQEYETKIIGEILKTGESKEYEKEYIRKDSSRVPILLTVFVVRDIDGRPRGRAVIIKDISERKSAEESLKKATQRLELQTWVLEKTNKEIRNLYKELGEKNKELQKLNQLKSDFVSTVSHELRTPMTSIRESISQVLDGMHGEINEQQKEFLSICLEEIDRLTRIISDILNISKIEAGKIELKRTIVNIVTLTKGVISSFVPQAQNKGLGIKEAFSAEIIEVYADKDKIIQVFTNLLGNAVKFTNKGYIEVSVVDKGDILECSISDTGKGIPKDELPKVFSKFQQFGSAMGDEKGTGLGLSITKSIVELHKGKIWAESELDKWTKFTFKLPKYIKAKELFAEYVTDGLNKALDEEAPLSILVFEITNFDDIQKKMGKEIATSIADTLGDVLKNSLRRKADKAIKDCHSVLMILPDTTRDDALRVEGRLRHIFYDYLSKNQLYDRVEIDCKIASFPEDGNTHKKLLSKIGVV